MAILFRVFSILSNIFFRDTSYKHVDFLLTSMLTHIIDKFQRLNACCWFSFLRSYE